MPPTRSKQTISPKMGNASSSHGPAMKCLPPSSQDVCALRCTARQPGGQSKGESVIVTSQKGPARVAGGPAFVRRPDDTVRFPLPFALRQGRREIRSAPRKFARPAQVRRTARPRRSSVGSPHLSILIGFLLASPLISSVSYGGNHSGLDASCSPTRGC